MKKVLWGRYFWGENWFNSFVTPKIKTSFLKAFLKIHEKVWFLFLFKPSFTSFITISKYNRSATLYGYNIRRKSHPVSVTTASGLPTVVRTVSWKHMWHAFLKSKLIFFLAAKMIFSLLTSKMYVIWRVLKIFPPIIFWGFISYIPYLYVYGSMLYYYTCLIFSHKRYLYNAWICALLCMLLWYNGA